MENTNQAFLEQCQNKAAELSGLLNTKVHPVVFKDPDTGEDIDAYVKEPSRMQKIAVLDKMTMVGAYSASAELVDVLLIKEHCHPRVTSERSEDDAVYIGVLQAVTDLVKLLVNQAKKKH